MEKDNISVILNVYKRSYTLRKQIDAILSQTVGIKSENIHVWINNPGTISSELETYFTSNGIKTYLCNYNTKFFGRFMIPLICQTEFVALFDDDIIPGKKWLENCLKSYKEQPGIYGGSGVIMVTPDSYVPNVKYGWNGGRINGTIQVDLVGHAWFLSNNHAKFMWEEPIPSWDNGEDIFLSYIAQKHKVNTYVPPHPDNDKEMWSNIPERSQTEGIDWGSDTNATYLTKQNHYPIRNQLVSDLVKKGWKLVHYDNI